MRHTCSTLVIHCIDFRFQKAIFQYLANRDLDEDCDVLSIAGVIKNLIHPENDQERDYILRQIKISYDLHHISKVIIMHHRDCGAYGGSKSFDTQQTEFERHVAEMKQARDFIKEKMDSLEVEMCFVELKESGGETQISFVDNIA